MEIYPRIEIRKLGLFLREYKVLVIGDLHVGYEEALNRKGVMVPRFGFKDLVEMLKTMLEEVETVVINGDLKHEFGRVSWTEKDQTRELLKIFSGKKIIFVQGNHDRIIKPLIKGMELVDDVSYGEIFITHGDELKDTSAKLVIIGHEHPAVGLREDERVEKYKCFLRGKWKRKVLIVMPSCNLLVEGTDILKESRLSPYLKKSIDSFEVFIVSDKVYEFGKVIDLN